MVEYAAMELQWNVDEYVLHKKTTSHWPYY